MNLSINVSTYAELSEMITDRVHMYFPHLTVACLMPEDEEYVRVVDCYGMHVCNGGNDSKLLFNLYSLVEFAMYDDGLMRLYSVIAHELGHHQHMLDDIEDFMTCSDYKAELLAWRKGEAFIEEAFIDLYDDYNKTNLSYY